MRRVTGTLVYSPLDVATLCRCYSSCKTLSDDFREETVYNSPSHKDGFKNSQECPYILGTIVLESSIYVKLEGYVTTMDVNNMRVCLLTVKGPPQMEIAPSP